MRLVHSTVCGVTRPWVRLIAVDQKTKGRLIARHADSCLRCQAEAAIEHRIHRTLAGMIGNMMMAPAGLIPAVRDDLEVVPFYTEIDPERSIEKVAIAAAVVGVASVVAWTVSRRLKSGG